MSLTRLQKAIDRFDLRAYLEEHFADFLEAAGGEEIRLCCFSPEGCAGVEDTKYHLYVNPSKKRWICFKCGYGKSAVQPGTGSLIQFMADVEGKHPIQIKDRLLGTVVPTVEDDLENMFTKAFNPDPKEDTEPQNVLKLPRYFLDLRADEGSRKSRVTKSFLKYANERGLWPQDLELWDIRYCAIIPTSAADKKHWRSRLIFPVYDLGGNLRTAVGRAVHGHVEKTPWVNWPGTNIGDLLWPLGRWKSGAWQSYVSTMPCSCAVLSEGIFDAAAVWHCGAQPLDMVSFCTFGKKISQGQIALLQKMGVWQVVLAWDRDAKSEIRAAVEQLSGAFERVFVFPFKEAVWNAHDLGDVLSGEVPVYLLLEELENIIDVESDEFLSWLMK